MNGTSPGLAWRRILTAVGAVIALSFALLTTVTAGYAFSLAFKARGAPDQAAISRFAEAAGRVLMPWLEGLSAFVVAAFASRKLAEAGAVHGLLIGALVGILNAGMSLAFAGRIGLRSALLSLVIAALGWLGGFAAQQLRHDDKPTTNPES